MHYFKVSIDYNQLLGAKNIPQKIQMILQKKKKKKRQQNRSVVFLYINVKHKYKQILTNIHFYTYIYGIAHLLMSSQLYTSLL